MAQARRHSGLLLALGLAALSALAPAAAEASIPSWHDRVDAKRFAKGYWAEEHGASTWCSGVRMRWRNYYEDYGVRRALAYVRPGGCTITFNKRVSWGQMPKYGWGDDWWRFCATAIHEFGHLPGMPFDGRSGRVHSYNPNHVMAASESLSTRAWWWPYHPACRYAGDDKDGDDVPDYRMARQDNSQQPRRRLPAGR
jgi:hypothetical protein